MNLLPTLLQALGTPDAQYSPPILENVRVYKGSQQAKVIIFARHNYAMAEVSREAQEEAKMAAPQRQ